MSRFLPSGETRKALLAQRPYMAFDEMAGGAETPAEPGQAMQSIWHSPGMPLMFVQANASRGRGRSRAAIATRARGRSEVDLALPSVRPERGTRDAGPESKGSEWPTQPFDSTLA